MNNLVPVIFGVVFLAFLVNACVAIYHLRNVSNLWQQAFMSQAPVSYLELCRMAPRKVPMEVVVKARIKAKHAGLDIEDPAGCTVERLESHFLAGGDIDQVITALIVAKSKGIQLDFAAAAQTDRADQA